MREQTGCDGVMIARGAQGNPWIFSELWNMKEQDGFLTDRMWKKSNRQCFGMPDSRSSIKVILQESGRCANMWRGIQKGLHGAARLRDQINQVESYAELENLLTSL